jgi:hypothetical protein
VTQINERSIRIAAGQLHGVAPNALFDLIEEAPTGKLHALQPFARAVVRQVGDEESELELAEGSSFGNRVAASIRVREVAPVPPPR